MRNRQQEKQKRLQLLERQTLLRTTHCNNCPDYPKGNGKDYRKKFLYCINECPIGHELRCIGIELEGGFDMSKVTITPEEFLNELTLGKTITQIEKEHGLSSGYGHYLIKKWGIRKQVDEILANRRKAKQEVTATSDKPHEQSASEEPKQEQHTAMESQKLTQQTDQEKDELNLLRTELDNMKAENQQLREELEKLRQQMPHIIEPPGNHTAHDPINHPAHYTAGKVECIEAIESATVGLTGGLAYCTGAAIKYLWRWSRKNGLEDLQKARWYVDRLIQLVQDESA